MGHLFINHVEAQIKPDFDVNVIDITGAQMVLCMKLSSFGWNVYDGTLSESSLSELQKDRAVRKHPSLIEFLSYAFFFPSLMTGPSYDYMEFARWMDLSMFDVIHKKASGDTIVKRRIPRSGRVATKKLVQGILWIVLWTQITNYISLEYAQSDKFTVELPFIVRAFYLYALGITYRLKYYGAWTISEGACILSGLGFNGKYTNPKTGKTKYLWNRVQNIDPWAFETGQNTHILLAAWNMNTNKWLKNYVYLRVTPKGRKPGFRSTLATFVTSALWHGTRPGYYLTFVGGAFFQSVGKLFRRNLRPIFVSADGVTPGPYKVYYDITCFVVTQLAFGYIVQPFIILDLKPSLAMWASVYYYVHIAIAISMFLFLGPPKKYITKALKKLQPVPLSHSEQIKIDSLRLKQIKADLDILTSQTSLGIPQPDIDHLDDEIHDAIREMDELRADLIQQLQDFRATHPAHR
ncbi:Ale1p [Sugiyamaella lignohabitans]|uniref:Ale1p n=1 Tax=Sugiyamaella lignohabitans TaxID=796027 RepID=A0A167F8B5_9ASCO|nr:Ale1p [Sugiyamaella lignohabitans]ANB14943.1 Ale1p [Sugiyamaella lignohabitans]